MFTCVVFLCIAIQFVVSVVSDPLVELADGIVQGKIFVTKNLTTYYGFQGIPYATPPLGNLRFEAPQAPTPWNGTWAATSEGKACMSVNHWSNPTGESEDCLYINVYTPDIQSASNLSVMFWIYGGKFTSGSSIKALYGPDFLIDEGVIVVTFNYRLGPFGFLSTGNKAIRGNAGLKDQRLALKWTYDNIAAFGGDPEKITIFGQSAGATSAGFHVLDRNSKGLFRAAILESGSALTYWAVNQNPQSYALSLANTISNGTYGLNARQLKSFFLGASADEIINATIALTPSNVTLLQSWPVIEAEGEDAFLTESPYNLLASGNFNKVPILIGVCSEESLYYITSLAKAQTVALGLDSFPSSIIPYDLQPNARRGSKVVEAIKSIYLQDEETFSNDLIAVANYTTDNMFVRGVIKYAELSSKFIPVYFYQFAYYGRHLSVAVIDGAEKVGHAAELPFIFSITGVSSTTSSADILTQNRMTKLWTNFANFLNPTPGQSELFNNIVWPTYSTNRVYFNINNTIELRTNLRDEAYSKWNDIYERYGKKPFVTY